VKILVTVKRVPDPEQRPKFKGAGLDISGANWVLNPFDEYAVETALRLTENGATGDRAGSEVVVLSIGPKEVTQQMRSALAMGADRGILVDGGDDTLDSDSVARIVKAVIEKEKPDLVVLGKQAVDGDANQVGQILAGLLGWAQATFAASVELPADEKSLTVSREVDAGVETKKIPLPGVLTVDLRIVAPASVKNAKTPATHAYAEGPRYASLKGIMAAKKKEIKEIKAADLGVTPAAKVKLISVEAPPPRKAGIKVADVNELVKRLAEEAKVL
jgi:electron transfer flavoprotein beta subunit